MDDMDVDQPPIPIRDSPAQKTAWGFQHETDYVLENEGKHDEDASFVWLPSTNPPKLLIGRDNIGVTSKHSN